MGIVSFGLTHQAGLEERGEGKEEADEAGGEMLLR
jgi:hypothetical protein